MESLSIAAFLDVYSNCPGLMPVGLVHNELIWLDMNTYHFYEGFFFKSLQMYQALRHNSEVFSCKTSLDVLRHTAPFINHLYPNGFIFHAGRSGSTLLAKVLAKSTENLVLSEASVHNSIWQQLAENSGGSMTATPEHLDIYRNLILAMGRHRVSSNKHYFIKFTSVNIHFFSLIHRAFPDVPSIFLKRDVGEIVQSWEEKGLPAWLNKRENSDDVLSGLIMPSLRANVEVFLEKAAQYPSNILNQIDYRRLGPEILPEILDYFKIRTSEQQIKLMSTQFRFDSKTELSTKLFNKKN